MRKVILTGSDGFIGKSFKKTLSKTWDVVAVSYTHLTLPTNREV